MGSIRPYMKRGKRHYRVLWRDPSHKNQSKSGFGTKRDAEAFLTEVEGSKNDGRYLDPAAGRVTVSTLGGDWFDGRVSWKPSYRRTMESAWTQHVLPRWGAASVTSIRPSQVQEWVAVLDSAGLSPSSVIRIHGVLAAILDSAVADGRIPSNPARRANLPRRVKGEHHYLTHAQVEALAAESGPHATLVRTLAYTGLRWGEATALRVHDLDMLRRRIRVHENAVEVGSSIIIGTPKTHQARSVPFPPFLSKPLATLCEGKGRDGIVFGDGWSFLRRGAHGHGWFAAAVGRCRAVDPTFPRVTFHDLRHTAASLAISAGANVKAVQRMLGHASASMTLDVYADLFPDDLDDVAQALDKARGTRLSGAHDSRR